MNLLRWKRVVSAASRFAYKSIRRLCTGQFQNRPGHLTFWKKKIWSNSQLCCQFRRSNAPPVGASKRVKSPTLQSSKATATVQILFACVKPFIQMCIFCNKQLATVWTINRPEQKSRGYFTAYSYLCKKLIQQIKILSLCRALWRILRAKMKNLAG